MRDTEAAALMTEPVLTVEPSARLPEIAEAMRSQGINSIVAVDDGCRPVGILTSTDFVGVVADGARDGTVGDHMTEAVVTTSSDTPARAVAELMCEHDISHVPVVENGEAVGLVSATDLTEHVAGAVADATE